MSGRITLLAAAALVSVGLVACGIGTQEGSGSAADATHAATPEPVASRAPSPIPTPSPTAAECPPTTGDAGELCQIVPSTANIFGAGQDEPPAPAGGGGGTLPTMWSVPPGTTIMTVTNTTGLVITDPQFFQRYGAGGTLSGRTDVTSVGGISGIVHGENYFFLVGVFLTDAPLSGAGPERLDFTGGEDFGELAPQVGQTFFIGDGAGRRFIVPSGASRLFLGFVDAFMYGKGEPGYYDNNDGQLAVTVEFTAE